LDKVLKIASATVNQTPLDWDNNLKHIRSAIDGAIQQKADILCLPELCITGYGCEDLFLSNWVSETAISFIPEIAGHCDGITVLVGLPIWLKNHNYNCTCVIQDKKILGINVKQFLANDGVHYEPRWFTAWKSGMMDSMQINGDEVPIGDFQFKVQDILCGIEICEDAWRPNRPACKMVDKGVKLILNPSASHFAIGKSLRRKRLVEDSSGTFHCAYVYANLLGNEAGRMIYDGELLIAHEGRLIQQNPRLSFEDVNIITAEINFSDPGHSRADFNFESIDRNEEFTRAVSLGLFDYLRKSRNKGFVLSLSGGADSSSNAVLVSEMTKRGLKELGLSDFLMKLGRPDILEQIESDDHEDIWKSINTHILTCAYQASQNSSEVTKLAAKTLAESVGSKFYTWMIDDEVSSYTKKIEKVIKRKLTWEEDDITLQNIQARSRSPIIWMLANIESAILLTTSNRSEGDVGYATMDGDTSGSLAPIAGIDKYFIRKWLKWAEKHLGYTALYEVNNLKPTAELRPPGQDQTDESDLMPYKILVEIEKLAVFRHLSPINVFYQLSNKNLTDVQNLKHYIIKFYQLWARNQWKRERIAPAFHLDDFNIDPRTWCRFPILSGSYDKELKELSPAKACLSPPGGRQTGLGGMPNGKGIKE
jgi:NAD+ synthase (glutamine-hydrolysing)